MIENRGQPRAGCLCRPPLTKNADELILISDDAEVDILPFDSFQLSVKISVTNIVQKEFDRGIFFFLVSLTLALMLAENEDSAAAINSLMKKTSLY